MFGQIPAYIALFLFPAFALYIFSKYERVHAVVITVLTGSLMLPYRVALDLPGIPPMDKEYITFLSAIVGIFIFHRRSFWQARPLRGPESLIVVMLLANFGTMMMNDRQVLDEGKIEDALGYYWLFATTTDDFLSLAIPFLVGRATITNFAALITFFRYLIMAGAIYCSLIAIEVAMSIPFYVWQLSNVIYGVPIRPMWRWGVIQPTLFMQNGLAIATFMGLSAIAATAINRLKLANSKFTGRLPQLSTYAGLFMTRNVAGNLYGFSVSFAVAFMKPKFVARIAWMIAVFVFVYPLLRFVDVFPHEQLYEFAAAIEPERARSLNGRFLEEEFVLANIGDRLFFGWGNVSRTPGAETFGTGETGLDGFWVIRLAARGMVGVVIYSFLLFYPIMVGWRAIKYLKDDEKLLLLGALMAMVAIRAGDLLINGWWNCLPMFLAGALLGVAKAEVREQKELLAQKERERKAERLNRQRA